MKVSIYPKGYELTNYIEYGHIDFIEHSRFASSVTLGIKGPDCTKKRVLFINDDEVLAVLLECED